jgi:hypothetical protein
MTSQMILRVGAVAALGSAAGQLVPGVLLPDEGRTAGHAVSVIAGNEVWTAARVIALAGVILTIVALSVVARTFTTGSGKEWAGVGLPLIVLAGGLASAHSLIAISHKALAESWATAPPGMRGPYLAAFDASWSASNVLANGADVLLGVYLITLAAAILAGGCTRAGSAGSPRPARSSSSPASSRNASRTPSGGRWRSGSCCSSAC